ncbi:arginine deiminase family protein [Brevibacterium luteolum]|uniref:Arginine deiminase n=1 Tax=Brevibacterium luteolum TaxID=199591 RepID=A0A2N6PEI4_9MICO|nr:arginine deiminase family protein [Brevibacterium luteolum]PMB97095.1 hypothetical protein CJ198_13335 [Brevibacterium luteolum]
MSALLFDDVPFAEAARSEHDGFTTALRDAGVSVPLVSELLAENLTVPEAGAAALEAVVDERACGTVAAASLSDTPRRSTPTLPGDQRRRSQPGG